MLHLSETWSIFYKLIILKKRGGALIASYPVRCDGRISQRVTEMLHPLPCCDAVSRHDETKQ